MQMIAPREFAKKLVSSSTSQSSLWFLKSRKNFNEIFCVLITRKNVFEDCCSLHHNLFNCVKTLRYFLNNSVCNFGEKKGYQYVIIMKMKRL